MRPFVEAEFVPRSPDVATSPVPPLTVNKMNTHVSWTEKLAEREHDIQKRFLQDLPGAQESHASF